MSSEILDYLIHISTDHCFVIFNIHTVFGQQCYLHINTSITVSIVPLSLCGRVGRVCRLWHSAAASPVLWRKVTLGHCWIAPGKSQLPKTEQKIKDTVNWLAENRSVLGGGGFHRFSHCAVVVLT